MDIHIKDEVTLPVKLYFQIGTKEEETIEFTPSLMQNTILFRISEYEKLNLRLENVERIGDFRVESLKGDMEISLLKNPEICLTDGSTNQDYGIIPGVYGIWLVDEGGEERCYFYEVTSHNLQSNQLELMKSALESRVLGITRDLFNQRRSRSSYDGSPMIIDTVNFLIKYASILDQSITNILNNPIEDVVKRHRITEVSKRVTAKSQRWNVTKGIQYKFGDTQTLFFEPKTQLDSEIMENRYLKYILVEILASVSEMFRQYQIYGRQLTTQINQLDSDIAKATNRRNAIEGQYNVEKSKKQLDIEIYSKSKECEQLRRQKEFLCNSKRNLQHLNAKLVYVLNETWVGKVQLSNKVQVTKRILRNRDYSVIHDIHQELKSKKKDKGDTPIFPCIQTSRLFEFYSFILCIDLIKEQGYEWKAGWIKDDEETKRVMFMLNSGEEVWFENEQGYRIQLVYDKIINITDTARQQGVSQLASPSQNRNRRPDILINLFNQDCFLRSMIIEVKYRKLKNIYRKGVDTDVMNQLIGYQLLRYFNPDGHPKFTTDVVKKIVVLYPEQSGSKDFIDENYGYEFISVDPTGFDLSTKGISLLNQSMKSFLEGGVSFL